MVANDAGGQQFLARFGHVCRRVLHCPLPTGHRPSPKCGYGAASRLPDLARLLPGGADRPPLGTLYGGQAQ